MSAYCSEYAPNRRRYIDGLRPECALSDAAVCDVCVRPQWSSTVVRWWMSAYAVCTQTSAAILVLSIRHALSEAACILQKRVGISHTAR